MLLHVTSFGPHSFKPRFVNRYLYRAELFALLLLLNNSEIDNVFTKLRYIKKLALENWITPSLNTSINSFLLCIMKED